MLAQLRSGAVLGADAYLVRVEVDVAPGLPGMSVVGLPESAVREGRERVASALHNAGFFVPPRRITVNLAPADVRKDGSAFDLPIAVGLLSAADLLEADLGEGLCCVGELGLDGELRPVRGAIAIALRCARDGVETLIVPEANAAEAAVVESLDVRAARSIGDVVSHLSGQGSLARVRVLPDSLLRERGGPGADYADVRGLEHAKRALEVAAAGAHNVLMLGPPGSGKSMLARRLPTILPPMTLAEALDVTRVHSVAGRLHEGAALVAARPFRAPHHGISEAALVGGGAGPRPGEVSLAHHGVLFLDELPEFRRPALEALRQPLEDGTIHIGRARAAVVLPARFMLVAALNPCPCGFHGDGLGRCTCHAGEVRRYLGRISGPLLDRIDLHVEVPSTRAPELLAGRVGESSAAIAARVAAARARQTARFGGEDGVHANAQMSVRDVHEHCRPDDGGVSLLRSAAHRLGLSSRATHRVLKVARTIADLAGEARISTPHIAEAIQYRVLDRRGRGAGV